MTWTLATWNVNSIRSREAAVLRWLEKNPVDFLCLQELKCQEEQFPSSFKAHGFNTFIVGQKTYNGVAILTRHSAELALTSLPSFGDAAARYVEIVFNALRIGNLYLPNGNSGGQRGLEIKADFFAALLKRAQTLLAQRADFAFLGDYNLCPTALDFAEGTLSHDDALIHPQMRRYWRRLLWSGLTDAYRALHTATPGYSFWDYQAGAFAQDRGLRIDHALLSPRLAERLIRVDIDRNERAQPRPSDHTPVIFTLRKDSGSA